MTNLFDLKLLDQYWIQWSRDPEGEPDDSTSHGKILLIIDNNEIEAGKEKDTDYGINQAAVELLKSVIINHKIDSEYPLFPHGCYVYGTCPNCIIDFQVEHFGDKTKISNIHVNAKSKYESLSVEIDRKNYAKKVYDFALKAFEFLPFKKNENKALKRLEKTGIKIKKVNFDINIKNKKFHEMTNSSFKNRRI